MARPSPIINSILARRNSHRGFTLAECLIASVVLSVTVLGVCGGLQMLGRTLADPEGVETTDKAEVDGLGLLDVHTRFDAAKLLLATQARFADDLAITTPATAATRTSAPPPSTSAWPRATSCRWPRSTGRRHRGR